MSRWFLSLSLMVIGGLGWRLASATEVADRPSVERGRDAVEAWQLNPGIWSVNAYDKSRAADGPVRGFGPVR